MGTHTAPLYTNLFMGKLEQELLQTQNKKPRVWWRYTDDIFAIWTHGERSLQTFLESLTRHHPTIKFTATWSAKEVIFLDTTVYLREGRIKLTCMLNLWTPTSSFAWIAATHNIAKPPSHTAKCFFYGEFAPKKTTYLRGLWTSKNIS